MNGIAAAAGISPGSLYQFFPSKPAVADALVERYVRDMHAMHERAFESRDEERPLEHRIGGIIDVIVEFQKANPAANALLAGANVSAELALATEALQREMCGRVEPLIASVAPGLSRRQRTLGAEVSIQIVRALMPMVLSASQTAQRAAVKELKRALVSYLTTLGTETRRQPAP